LETVADAEKILTMVFVVLVLGSVGVTYYRYIVQKDFLVKYETPCEPSEEACFVYECDLEADECTGNPEEDTTYYSLMYRKAYNIPECDVEVEGDCDDAYVCPDGEEGCSVVTCTEETATAEEVTCSDPRDFPVEEEVSEEMMEEAPVEEETVEVPVPETQPLETPAVAPEANPAAPVPAVTPSPTTSAPVAL